MIVLDCVIFLNILTDRENMAWEDGECQQFMRAWRGILGRIAVCPKYNDI